MGMREEDWRQSDILLTTFQPHNPKDLALVGPHSWQSICVQHFWWMGIWLYSIFSGEKQCLHKLFVICACDFYLFPFHLFIYLFSLYLYKRVRDIYFIVWAIIKYYFIIIHWLYLKCFSFGHWELILLATRTLRTLLTES